jgi:hypothetical protein
MLLRGYCTSARAASFRGRRAARAQQKARRAAGFCIGGEAED